MSTPIKNGPAALSALLAVGAIAAGVTGCGGYSAARTSASTSAAASSQRYAPTASPAAASSGIPQHNGGDRDPDNNGGPSDGDGNQ